MSTMREATEGMAHAILGLIESPQMLPSTNTATAAAVAKAFATLALVEQQKRTADALERIAALLKSWDNGVAVEAG